MDTGQRAWQRAKGQSATGPQLSRCLAASLSRCLAVSLPRCLAASLAILLAGCVSRSDLTPARATITSERREPVVAHETRTIRHADGRVETVVRTENTGPTASSAATAEGPGLSVSGHDIQQGFDAAPPAITLGDASSSGGGLKATSRARIELAAVVGRAAVHPLFWVGAALLLGGIACFIVPIPLRRAGTILIAAAVGAIACSFLPAWGWWIIAALVLGLGGVYAATEMGLWKRTREQGRLRYAAAGIIRGVEHLPPEVKARVKEQVDLVTDDEDKAVIRAIKRQEM